MEDSNFSVKQKRLMIILPALALILVVVFLGYRSVTFRITGTNPSVGAVSTTAPFFKINFNKPLAKNVSVTVSPQNVPISYGIKGSVITISFHEQLLEGQTYSVRLAKIADTKGQHLSNKVFAFQAQSISPSDLPKDQQQALEANQARFNAIKGDKLVQLLPFTGGGNEFQVSYTVNYAKQTPQLIIVINSTTPQGQTDALNWIREVGADPSAYTITFVSPSDE